MACCGLRSLVHCVFDVSDISCGYIVYLVNTIITAYCEYTASKRETQVLHMNIDTALLERVDKYRFKKMFATRSEAIEFPLEAALELNPERPAVPKDAAG